MSALGVAVVNYADMPRLVALSLTDYFFPDWDERWKSDRYLVTYRIWKDQVEETFSFTPNEIDEAIAAAAEQLTARAQASGHALASPEKGRPVMPTLIESLGRVAMASVDYLVRSKHGCDVAHLPLRVLPQEMRRAIETMTQSGHAPRGKLQRHVRSMMVFGLMLQFIGRQVDHDHLEITDWPTDDDARRAGVPVPAPTAEEAAMVPAGNGAPELRTIGSSRIGLVH